MSAARIITPPLSGGDRKHFARELHRAEVAYQRELREAVAAHAAADAALAKAYALDCIAWTTRQFIGSGEDPSPTIAAASRASTASSRSVAAATQSSSN